MVSPVSEVKAKSVCILHRDEKTKKLKFDFEALKSVLTRIGERPIVIFSVNGGARTGKSFLLSNLFACLSVGLDPYWIENVALDAFPWRNGQSSETKGIRISTEPLITTRKGREIALLFMDTEGSFSSNTMNENTIIFAVSAILSSLLIFNVMRTIDEATLQFFSIFCSVANRAKTEDGIPKDSGFQKVIFLVRDFDFAEYKWGYYDDNKKPKEQGINFKKLILDPQPKSQSEENLKPRENLRKWFKEIGVYLMPDPGKALRREDKVIGMEPDFEEHLFKFIKCVISDENLKIKKIHDKEVTALELLEKVSFLTEIFNGEQIATVDTIFDSIEKMKYNMEKASAVDYLFTLIPAGSIPDDDIIKNCYKLTVKKFQEETHLQNEEYLTKFEGELNLIIEVLRIITNYKEGIQFLKELLERAEALDTGCKIGKTTGTVASVGGALLGFSSAVCFALAPVTGGLTLGLGVAALTTGLAGGATKITTSVTNKVKSKKFHTELLENHKQRMELLKTILKRLDENLYFKTFEQSSEAFGKLPDNSANENGESFHGNFVLNTTLSTTATTANSTTGAMLIADAVIDSAGTVITASAREVVKRVSAGISIVFAAYEIFDLVNQWTPNHPLTPEIRNLIDQYENEITAWQSLSRTLER